MAPAPLCVPDLTDTLWPGHSVARPDSVWPGQILCGQARFCVARPQSVWPRQSGRMSRSGQAEIRPENTEMGTGRHGKGQLGLIPHPNEAHGCHGLHGHHGFPQNPPNPPKSRVFPPGAPPGPPGPMIPPISPSVPCPLRGGCASSRLHWFRDGTYSVTMCKVLRMQYPRYLALQEDRHWHWKQYWQMRSLPMS